MTKYDLLKSKIEKYSSHLSRSAGSKVRSQVEKITLQLVAEDLANIIQVTENTDPKLIDKE